MFKHIPSRIKSGLWPHQARAIKFAVDHLNSSIGACLIRMPTGTGKTGVIACLVQYANPASSLVVTPWGHLRDQMVRDLKGGFWGKTGLQPSNHQISELLPSTVAQVLAKSGPKVLVCTFATLNEIRREYPQAFSQLSTAISLVAVDEGHYEPAVEWGKSVKGLGSKTVLLTATPYRNDLKLFRIADPSKSVFHFTHSEAESKGIIRGVQFEELPNTGAIAQYPADFAKFWKAAKAKGRFPSSKPKAIVCCGNAAEIEQVVIGLQSAELKTIGIHERFEGESRPGFYKEVPDPSLEHAEIWVHQHKLTEGLDSAQFCCVAFFTPMRNDRKLIQQLGRILRCSKTDGNVPALVVAPSRYLVQAQWEAYREYEIDNNLSDPEHYRNIVQVLLREQPAVEYFDGRFRKRFDPAALQSDHQVVISPSVLVREVRDGFELDEYVEDCTDTLNTMDAVIVGPDPNRPCVRTNNAALWVYATIRNSSLLGSRSLYEVKLETHCVVVDKGLLFVADTSGTFPEEYVETKSTPLAGEALARYIDSDSRPTNVNINSSIPYDTVLRGADLRGHNLATIPASLTDRVQICRSVRGVKKDSGRRYVGLQRGRVRDEISQEARRSYDLPTFVGWVTKVATALRSSSTPNAIFGRYMPVCEPPDPVVPRTLSIDLQRRNLVLTTNGDVECSLQSASCAIREDGGAPRHYRCEFDLAGSGGTVELGLKYQHEKRRFAFSKAQGASIRVSESDGESTSPKSLPEYLTQHQDIVLVGLEGGEVVYQGRSFYRIDYGYAELSLLGLIETPPGCPSISSEKGSKEALRLMRVRHSRNFPANTLFRAITDGVLLPFKPEVLICDDLGTECADFVAADISNRKIAFVHAKADNNKSVSASAFHEVVAQAMKNLAYLSRNGEVPSGASSWTRSAKWNQTSVPRLMKPLPRGIPDGRALWAALKSRIIDASNAELWVVLATSGCCDLDCLQKAVTDPKARTPETAQVLHLFDGLNGYARQLGVKLKIYDAPKSV